MFRIFDKSQKRKKKNSIKHKNQTHKKSKSILTQDDGESNEAFDGVFELLEFSSEAYDISETFDAKYINREILHLQGCAKLSDALDFIKRSLNGEDLLRVEVSLTEKVDEFTESELKQIKEIFPNQRSFVLFINSNIESSNNFILWSFQGRSQIYVLHLEPNEIEISSFINKFLVSALKNEHDGLLKSFKYDGILDYVFVNIFSIGDTRDYNLLFIAAEHGDVKAVKCLLQFGFEIPGEVVNLCYRMQKFGCLVELLKANSIYPDNYNNQEVPDYIKDFLALSTNMHSAIKDHKIDDVKVILEQNPTLKYFYDSKNNSACTYAIVNSSFDIYELFLTKNICFGPREDLDEIFDYLSKRDQEKLKSIHEKHSKGLIPKHLLILLSNSSYGHDAENDQAKIAAVTLAYQTLDKDPRLSIILKIVAAYRNFKITFDFKRDSVRFLNPSIEGYVNGLFSSSGKVLVAAKDLTIPGREHIFYGILAHELCHFAVFLTYDNLANPYFSDDLETIALYSSIVTDCERNKIDDEIMELAFLDEYPESMRHAEVIVRYPQILAHYHDQPQEISKKSLTYESLKMFYENNVMRAFENALPIIAEEAEDEIRGTQLRVKKQITAMKSIIFILALVLVFGISFTYFFLQGPTKLWNDLSPSEKETVRNNIVAFNDVNVRFQDLFRYNSTAYSLLSPYLIDNALKNKSEGINLFIKETLHHEIYLVWDNSTDSLKQKILNSDVMLQGERVQLKKILSSKSYALSLLSSSQIKKIISGKLVNIGEKFIPKFPFFIDRRFRSVLNDSIISKQEAIDITFNNKFFILTDGPGYGKTASFQNFAVSIKKLHPDYWVSFIALKDHIDVLNSSTKGIKFGSLKDISAFIGKEILKIKDTELETFCELFYKNKTVLIWDAFDEVDHRFDELLISMFHKISQSKNIQFISTRPQYQKFLEDNLSHALYDLIPFDDEDRRNYLKKELSDLPERNATIVLENIFNQVKSLESDPKFKGTINTPIILRMVSEIMKDDEKIEVKNRFKLYEKFVEKQIQNKQKKQSITTVQQKFGEEQIHQIFALRLIINRFPNDYNVASLNLMQNEKYLNKSDVASYGLMILSKDGNLEFIHKTFAEFFVAQYIVDNLYNFRTIEATSELILRLKVFFESIFHHDVVSDILSDYLEDLPSIDDRQEKMIIEITKLVKRGFLKAITHKMNFESLYISQIGNIPEHKYEIIRKFFLRPKDEQIFEAFLLEMDIEKVSQQLLLQGAYFNESFRLETKLKDTNEWLKHCFGITCGKCLNSNNQNAFLQNNQKGSILFNCWKSIQQNKYSFAHAILKYTNFSDVFDQKICTGSFDKLFAYMKANLTKEEMHEMLNENFVYIFDGETIKNETFKEVWFTFTNLSTDEEISEKMQYKYELRGSILNIVLSNYDIHIINFMLDEIQKYIKNKSEVINLIKHFYYGHKKVALSDACQNSNKDVLKSFWKFFEKYFSFKEQKEYLFSQKGRGENREYKIIRTSGCVDSFLIDMFDENEQKEINEYIPYAIIGSALVTKNEPLWENLSDEF